MVTVCMLYNVYVCFRARFSFCRKCLQNDLIAGIVNNLLDCYVDGDGCFSTSSEMGRAKILIMQESCMSKVCYSNI